ncbi:MAG: MFS transporter [Betaproteobacteria bacterium]|nr:MFS transporter [Betaproteobacteria bacterium]
MQSRPVALMLNAGHAIDHMFLLIFATAVTSIAAEFGFSRWEDLMPYSVGAAAMFGAASLPAGRLGDLWGRRPMMLVYWFGMGASTLLVAMTQGPWQIAAALTVLGIFSAVYHPIAIPMLLQHSKNPGLTVGFNGLVGNLGIAASAVVTGFLVKYFGWRAAFVVPGLVAIGLGVAFALIAPRETEAPAKRRPEFAPLPRGEVFRVVALMTATATVGGFLFNFTTNSNQQLLGERMAGIISDPAVLGSLLAGAYVVGSLAQIVVGRLIDHYPLRQLYIVVLSLQPPLLALAAIANGWTLYAFLTGFMIAVFGAVPFTDAMLVRYVDDRLRSRVAGMRLTIAFTVSAVAVWVLGPAVKAVGFQTTLLSLAALGLIGVLFAWLLPQERRALRVATDDCAS